MDDIREMLKKAKKLHSLLKRDNKDFNVFKFVGCARKEDIPPKVISDVLDAFLKAHYKLKKSSEFWAYGIKIFKIETPNYWGAKAMEEHSLKKKDEMSGSVKGIIKDLFEGDKQ